MLAWLGFDETRACRLVAISRSGAGRFLGPYWARLLDGVMAAPARAVGFDVIFAYSANRFLPDHERDFLASLNRHRQRVVLARTGPTPVAIPSIHPASWRRARPTTPAGRRRKTGTGSGPGKPDDRRRDASQTEALHEVRVARDPGFEVVP